MLMCEVDHFIYIIVMLFFFNCINHEVLCAELEPEGRSLFPGLN
jgi:hypothetical protein